jgi:hypothetical protein
VKDSVYKSWCTVIALILAAAIESLPERTTLIAAALNEF